MVTMGRDNCCTPSRALGRMMRRAMKCAKPTGSAPFGRRAKIAFAAALALPALMACADHSTTRTEPPAAAEANEQAVRLRTGAERIELYLPMLEGYRVAVVTNQTGRIGQVHLVDSLLALGVRITKVFAPEHGFRGDADAGEHVKDQRDARTGLPIVSLYGNNKKPTEAQLADVDVLLFDIQDVGVRFYTYISTLHYVMEAAASHGRKVVVLDRPNPNGFFVDGPVLEPGFTSFVGMHPVPLVHGMTIGEYAGMIAGEGWLHIGAACDLTVVPCEGYDHSMAYELPVPPSPNLRTQGAIHLYPALGLFEGTVVSVGRGTDHPFQCIGFPGSRKGDHTFTPEPKPGAKDPPHKGKECRGYDLRGWGAEQLREEPRLHLQWLLDMYEATPDKSGFFNNFFDKLAGTDKLRKRVLAGWDEERIRAEWQPALQDFRKVRARYLLYPDVP